MPRQNRRCAKPVGFAEGLYSARFLGEVKDFARKSYRFSPILEIVENRLFSRISFASTTFRGRCRFFGRIDFLDLFDARKKFDFSIFGKSIIDFKIDLSSMPDRRKFSCGQFD